MRVFKDIIGFLQLAWEAYGVELIFVWLNMVSIIPLAMKFVGWITWPWGAVIAIPLFTLIAYILYMIIEYRVFVYKLEHPPGIEEDHAAETDEGNKTCEVKDNEKQ